MAASVKGQIMLTDGRMHTAYFNKDSNRDCAAARRCVCGFCKAADQCSWADCRNVRRSEGGTLCFRCAADGWPAINPGHWTPAIPSRTICSGLLLPKVYVR